MLTSYRLSKSKPLMLATLFFASIAHADLTGLQGQFSNTLEELAATANQNTYSALTAAGAPCTGLDTATTGTGTCTGAIFSVFENVRELVHTANELTGIGPTIFSLGSDLQGLGFALRWTAGEEFAAQGSMSSEFVNGQLSGLASRLGALRVGASGFSFAGFTPSHANKYWIANSDQNRQGGGASGDSGETYSRLGGFFNWSYGWGEKDPTALEDAFDFDGASYTLGVDYRLSSHWTIGSTVGYNDQVVDFDSAQSVVDGGINATGFSIMPFAMYQADSFFVSASLGYQDMSFDLERQIKYPSINPSSDSTNTTTLGNTDSTTLSYFFEIGYSLYHRKWTVEPYANFNGQEVTIDAFTEIDLNDSGFNLNVDEQKIDSAELSAGLKIAYTLTPSFGVFTPYIDVTYRNQLEDDTRTVSARYANLPNISTFAIPVEFAIQTDQLDSEYYTYTLGVAAVIKGAQADACGNVSGGLQGFVNFKTIEAIDNYQEQVISAGLRYEFPSGSNNNGRCNNQPNNKLPVTQNIANAASPQAEAALDPLRTNITSADLPKFYFEFDVAALSDATVSVLNEYARHIIASNKKVRLEGHADERGTREYNMALGDERANRVANFLLSAGVLRKNITAISYGEERPAVSGSDGASYAKNRRVEIILIDP